MRIQKWGCFRILVLLSLIAIIGINPLDQEPIKTTSWILVLPLGLWCFIVPMAVRIDRNKPIEKPNWLEPFWKGNATLNLAYSLGIDACVLGAASLSSSLVHSKLIGNVGFYLVVNGLGLFLGALISVRLNSKPKDEKKIKS